MGRLKTKQAARSSQNTNLLQEAGTLFNDNTDIAKLKGIFDRLTSSDLKLSIIYAAIEKHIPVDQLEAEYDTAAEYNDQAIAMLAEMSCQIAALEPT
ncbi:hypothetical protein HPB50_001270 [Hyalomma asiaticum]|uniref:Uncharacterized protein n=1 Tax=Hyalomma asiaticum TaxID=266040 RepID=A0ACB7RPS7_HYAAI|nr:hypothetical protein HPB50_001270 [Hyalomma asiaticum]